MVTSVTKIGGVIAAVTGAIIGVVEFFKQDFELVAWCLGLAFTFLLVFLSLKAKRPWLRITLWIITGLWVVLGGGVVYTCYWLLSN